MDSSGSWLATGFFGLSWLVCVRNGRGGGPGFSGLEATLGLGGSSWQTGLFLLKLFVPDGPIKPTYPLSFGFWRS